MTDFFYQLSGHQDERQQKLSIIHHLELLLNSRQGCLNHMPDYGLPDYGSHPSHRSAKQYFIEAIEALVKRYEPRIESLRIKEVESRRQDCVLQLELNARINTLESIQLDTLLFSGGRLLVQNGIGCHE